jgi:Gpi18-like mannosyltransferase
MNLRLYSIFVLSIIICIYYFSIPNGFLFDINCFAIWTVYIKECGLQFAYENRVDYPPTIVYILSFIGSFYHNSIDILKDYKTLKIITFLFSALNGYLIYFISNTLTFGQKEKPKILKYSAFLYLINPGVFLNTIVWGQVDEIAVFFLLTSIILSLKHYYNSMLVCLVLMVNFKIITLIFIPFFLAHLLFFSKNINITNMLRWFLITLIATTLIYLPFLINHQFYRLNKYIAMVDTYPVLSANAYNFWYFVSTNPFHTSDKINIGNIISFKVVGQTLFLLFGGFMCLRDVFFRFLKRQNKELKSWILLMSITLLLMFFFHTQMHERYSHLTIGLLAITAFSSGKKSLMITYFLVSAAYAVNILDVFLKDNGQFAFNLNINPVYITYLYLVGIVFSILAYFRMTSKSFGFF